MTEGSARRLRALLVAGGALGTGLRYACFEAWPVARGTFPTTTLAINAIGAFALALLLHATSHHHNARELRAFVGVGVLGGFTTFSAYAVELAEHVRDGNTGSGVVYALAMTVVGLLAALLGIGAAHVATARGRAS